MLNYILSLKGKLPDMEPSEEEEWSPTSRKVYFYKDLDEPARVQARWWAKQTVEFRLAQMLAWQKQQRERLGIPEETERKIIFREIKDWR